VSDLLVTIPRDQWFNWLAYGDLVGQPWTGCEWGYYLSGRAPIIRPGVCGYIVCNGRLRGYAPLVRIARRAYGFELVRQGGAVAVTVDFNIPGFRGWRARWWKRREERPFPNWKDA